MSASLPSALRARFPGYIAEGLSGRAAALRLKVSAATGARWARKIRETGRIDPAAQGRPRGSGKLAPQLAFFEDLIGQDPDITLFGLRDALTDAIGLELRHSAIGYRLPTIARMPERIVFIPPSRQIALQSPAGRWMKRQ
jgi:transposase